MPQTQLRTRLAVVGVRNETTVDTYLEPTLTQCFLARISDTPWSPVGADFSPDYQRPDFLAIDESSGARHATISFKVPLKGSGVAGTKPQAALAYQACGMAEVISAGVSVTYIPRSVFDGAAGNPHQSYSVAVFENGVRYAIKGAFGNMVLMGEVGGGEPGWADIVITGAYVAPADVAVPVPTYETTNAPAFRGGAMTIGGFTPKGVRALSLDLGNVIAVGQDYNESTGVYGARITGRRTFGSIDPEMTLVATHDWFGQWTGTTTGVFTTGPWGTAGNRVTITANRVRRRLPTTAARDGIRALGVPFSIGSVQTDVELTQPDIALKFD